MGDDFVKREKENCVKMEDNIEKSPKLLMLQKWVKFFVCPRT